jgi:hypothetical protein
MSNITADFISATKKIHADVRAVLTALHLIQSDVKIVRDKIVSEPSAHGSDQQTGEATNKQGDRVVSTGHLQKNQSGRQARNTQQEAETGFQEFKRRFWKSTRKPKFYVELVALLGLIAYTCETKRTNDLTQEALNLQSSLARSFIQITGTAFGKTTIDDVVSSQVVTVEVQNVGKAITSNVHGPFVVEFPLAQQEPSLDLNNINTTVISPPLYPGAPPEPLGLIFVATYGTIPQVPSQVIQDLKDGTRYAVVFGRIDYDDSFGQWWTQFCFWRHFVSTDQPSRLVSFPARRCTDYNVTGGTPKKN